MSTAARYWQLHLLGLPSNTWKSVSLGGCRWFGSKGENLSKDLTDADISASGNNETHALGARSNLVDGSNTTDFVMAIYYDGTILTYSFDFKTKVLPEYVEIVFTTTRLDYWTDQPPAHLPSISVMMYSSENGVDWDPQSAHLSPFSAHGKPYKLLTTVSSKDWPVPSRTLLGGSGGIYGIVSEEGVAMPNRPIYLFERQLMTRIGFTTTDEYGGYAFNGLNENNEYMVLSVDPSGPPYKNALVWDRVTPINAKGNLQSASSFFARRIRHPRRGGAFACSTFLSGPSHRWMGGSVLGEESHWFVHDVHDGSDFVQVGSQYTAGGDLKFLKSGRTPTNIAWGITLFDGHGVVSDLNEAGQFENYAALTFEYIFKAPTLGETGIIIVHGGTRDSDDTPHTGEDAVWGYAVCPTGPTLEVSSDTINVRFPLGAANRSIVRCTAPIVGGSVYHVMVSYAQDSYIELYVNGVSVQKTTIEGGGRLYGQGHRVDYPAEEWDVLPYSGGRYAPGYLRRLTTLHICGYGAANTSRGWNHATTGSGWGGAIAFVGKYYSTFSAADVSTFYDSYINRETHIVPTTQSGYMAQVEQDNPYFYTRLNDLSIPRKLPRVLGAVDYWGSYEPTCSGFGKTGFVSGTTSVNLGGGAIVLRGLHASTTFTAEFFCRQTVSAGTQFLFLFRRWQAEALLYVYASNGALYLVVTDVAQQTVTIPLGFTLIPDTAYHVAITYNPWTSKVCKLYIDGVKISEKPAPIITDVYAQGWCNRWITWLGIGCNPSAEAPSIDGRFQGEMGEFALYKHELQADRIASHYSARNL